MAVAMDLFCERDFASVTIKDIARAAKVNSALIYYYFADKEDLFRVMIEHAILRALDNYARLKRGILIRPISLMIGSIIMSRCRC